MSNNLWAVICEGADGHWVVSQAPTDLAAASAYRARHQRQTPTGRPALHVVSEADAKRLNRQPISVRPRHYRL